MAVLTSDFARDRGSEAALIDESRSVTWADLNDRVNRLVNGLRNLGLSTGDTIAVVAGNQCEWFEIAQACAHGGWTLYLIHI
jgi:long-chain acyl-CoA synthetase